MVGSTLLLVQITVALSANAQLVNRSIARWAVGDAIYRGEGYGRVQYGASGYSYDPVGAQTAYGNAVRAQADLTMAQGRAAVQRAKANESNENARKQSLENKARYNEIRSQQREAIEERKAAEDAARRERAANRRSVSPTELYPRLSVDQLDATTGKISWPECLKAKAFEKDREQIEAAVKSIAENGPDQRTAGIIRSVANEMKSGTNDLMPEIGFERYLDARKFLGSLSVEGYYALEEL